MKYSLYGSHQQGYNLTTVTPSSYKEHNSLAMFIWLIIRFIQLVFSAETVFFSHKKSANSVFQPAYNSSQTGPLYEFV
jgi:hypothetical protein